MTGTLAPELTVADRCDRCGAQAYVRARLADDLELLFCGHHGREHLDKLKAMEDVDILDESHRLTAEAVANDPLR
ncbi:DUF7455 domain-containing protein [Ornithinicoccus halotolerans]|uniref:DUF7455 domain-containing protein n=1 Tax=Ornithinicoccus halotolerans TaxID=1748220 RepID=UPI001297256D|nr:hypothetical protein [Ornithinicoccus halotolerans]